MTKGAQHEESFGLVIMRSKQSTYSNKPNLLQL